MVASQFIYLFVLLNSSLNRVLVPTVLMEVKTSDGNVKSFEVGNCMLLVMNPAIYFVKLCMVGNRKFEHFLNTTSKYPKVTVAAVRGVASGCVCV